MGDVNYTGKGSLQATGSTLYDRNLDVYGVELIVGGAVGGQGQVTDEWAHKVAQSIVMIMDPSGSGINVVAQERMKDVLAGEQGTWHAGSHTYQRILKGSGDEYPLNPLADFIYGDLDAYYGSGTEALLNGDANDMVWYQNSSHDGVTTTGDNDITELFEHIMHTLHVHGVRGAVEGSVEALNYYKTNQEPYEANDNSWKTSELYLAVKEAVENGIFYPEYAPDLLNNSKAFEVAAKEYTYSLNFSMWEMGKEFWTDKNASGDGSLEPEWSDSALTPEDVLLVNPLGYSPIGSLADQSVEAGISLNLSEILSSSSSDGGSYSWFKVYDATGGNNFVKNGVEIDASAGAWVSASDLANTTIKGDNQASEQTLWFQTYEGGTYSAWDSLVLTTTGSVAVVAQPIGSLTDQTVAAGSSVDLSEILSSTNANGGSYSWINVYDATGGNNFVKSGVEIDASVGAWVSTSDLADTVIKADNQASEQTLWLRTYEGGTYSAWDSLTFTTTGSAAAVAQPVGSIADQTVAAGSSLNLSEILSSTNADGGSYSWFNVYDATGGNNFVKNGVEIDASAGAWVSASDLANTTIKGDSQASEQTLYFQTYDGADYSAWDSVILTTTVEI